LLIYDGVFGIPFNYKVQALRIPFKDLQKIRTRSDYKLGEIFTKNEAKDAINQAKALETFVMALVEEIQNQSP